MIFHDTTHPPDRSFGSLLLILLQGTTGVSSEQLTPLLPIEGESARIKQTTSYVPQDLNYVLNTAQERCITTYFGSKSPLCFRFSAHSCALVLSLRFVSVLDG